MFFFLETLCFRYLSLGLLQASAEPRFREHFNELLTLSIVCVVCWDRFRITKSLLELVSQSWHPFPYPLSKHVNCGQITEDVYHRVPLFTAKFKIQVGWSLFYAAVVPTLMNHTKTGRKRASLGILQIAQPPQIVTKEEPTSTNKD